MRPTSLHDHLCDSPAARNGDTPHVKIVIIGSGFSGLGLAIRLKEAGIEDFVILERAEDVGGTWEANTYPGCQCDIPSHLYSFSFALNPELDPHVSASGGDLGLPARAQRAARDRPHIRFGPRARPAAAWDEDAQRWRVETSHGTWTAQLLIDGSGGLSHPSIPAPAGPEDLPGRCSTLRSGTTTTTSRQARGRHRHGRIGDPVRAAHPAAGRQDACLPAHRAVGPAPPRSPDDPRGAPAVPQGAVRAEARARPRCTGTGRASCPGSSKTSACCGR